LTAVLIGWLAACSVDSNAPPNGADAGNTAAASDKADLGCRLSAWTNQQARCPAHRAQGYLVKFRAPTGRGYAASVISASGLNIKRTFLSIPGLHHVVAAAGINPDVAAAQLAREPSVEYIEPNFIVSADAVPNDPLFTRRWDRSNTGQLGGTSTVRRDIGALAARNITTCSASVVIAVIDTGVDYKRVDLAANMWVNPTERNNSGLDNDGNGYVNDCHGVNAITHSGDPMDDYFHGTQVPGTIGAAGNSAVGVAGINWNVAILACKVLHSRTLQTLAHTRV